MEMNEILVIAMFVSFIALLFTGFPVAWALAGIGVLFAGVGYLADNHLDTMTGLDYSTWVWRWGESSALWITGSW